MAVICSQDGDKFWKMPECYIRGSTIKYLRIPDEIIDMVKEEVQRPRGEGRGRGRGGRGGGGRGMYLFVLSVASIVLLSAVIKRLN
mgnify:CR=1 FL=1